MASTTLVPVSDGTGTDTNFITDSGAATSLYTTLVDASDTTYVQTNVSNTTNATAWFQLSTLPGNLSTVTSIIISLRLSNRDVKDDPTHTWTAVRIYKNDQSTAITANSTITATNVVTTYTFSPSVTTNTNAAWTNAKIAIAATAAGGTVSPACYECSVALTYAASTTLKPRAFFNGGAMSNGIKSGGMLCRRIAESLVHPLLSFLTPKTVGAV